MLSLFYDLTVTMDQHAAQSNMISFNDGQRQRPSFPGALGAEEGNHGSFQSRPRWQSPPAKLARIWRTETAGAVRVQWLRKHVASSQSLRLAT